MSECLRRLRRLALALFILLGLPALLIQLALLAWRPMFYNELVMHDGLPFLHWWPQGPYCDDRGNAAVADYRRNLLVVFLTAKSEIATSRFYFYSIILVLEVFRF